MRFSSFPCLVHILSVLTVINPIRASFNRRDGTCNGHAELCERSYANVTFVGAHNSYAVGTNNLAVNQDVDVTQQLKDGIRLLQMQTHNQNGVIQLCHTSCVLYNGGTLADYLTKVKSWMDANPTEVVTLLIVNSDNFKPSAYASVFTSAGLDKLSYSPPTASLGVNDWPTMSALINAGTRLVTFMDTQADFTSVPWIIDEFTSVWETAFDVTDPSFDCNVNRTRGDSGSQMYLINHFLDQIVLGQPAPDKDRANTTNAISGAGSLGEQVNLCAATHQRYPNFLLVDFYQYGPSGAVFQVAATANGVTYTPSTPIASTGGNGTTSSSTSSSSSTNSASQYHREGLSLTGAVMFLTLALF
jgi:hypothetical protein